MTAPAVSPNATWGRPAWHYVHAVALQTDRDATASSNTWFRDTFVPHFAHTIPCATCRTHFLELLSAPAAPSAFRWTVDLHNAVNTRLGKPSVSYARARRMHAAASSPACCPPRAARLVLAAAGLVLVMLAAARRRRYK